MSNQKLVIALGGNALGKDPQEQLELVKKTAETIASFAGDDYDLIITHGNGPQVGIINLAFETANINDPSIPYMPFAECGAMSQGYIGYHLSQAIQNELKARHIKREVCSLICQTVVDKGDRAFQNPTKPVGMFYTKEQAEELAKEKGFIYVEDAGRGYRRVVPSPIPKKIIELNTMKALASQGVIVVTSGGGGIPVIEDENGYHGTAAVIDKDRSAAKIAIDIQADMLLILTAVEYVYVDFNRPTQRALKHISAQEAKDYMMEGQFAKGSMLPKIEACLSYLDACPNGTALITSLEKAPLALQGKTGTIIENARKLAAVF